MHFIRKMLQFLLTSIFVAVTITVSQSFLIKPRIINGIRSNITDFPFYALIEVCGRYCGGSLISDTWVITAAHCTSNEYNAHVQLGIGVNGDFYRLITARSKEQISHPNYVHDKFDFDIGLLRLPYPATPGINIRLASLPHRGQPQHLHDESVIVVGTGHFTLAKSKINQQKTLRQASFQTISNERCTKLLKNLKHQRSVICVNVMNNQSGYDGDSGGPLIRQYDGALIGVMNFVYQIKHCTNPQDRFTLQVFADIRFYYDWISQVTGLQMPYNERFSKIKQSN